jgi:hypothetical protein
MDNSECFGVKFVKIYPEMTSQIFLEKNMVLVDYIGFFFTFPNTFDRWMCTCNCGLHSEFCSW